MNALSKVLVVVILVLSVAFAVSQMVLHGKREDYGKLYVQARKAHEDAQQQVGNLEDQVKDLTVQRDQIAERGRVETEALDNDLRAERDRVLKLQGELENLTVGVTRLTDRATKLENDVAARDEIVRGLEGTVAQRDKTIADNLSKIEGLQNDVAVRDEKIGGLEFDLTEQKKAYAKLAQSEERLQAIIGELVERGVHVPPAPLPIINGRVVRVDMEHSVAVLDKGANSGVKPNTQFVVYNDDRGYVAKLIIHDVQPDVSAGRITLLANGEVKQGDKATTEIP